MIGTLTRLKIYSLIKEYWSLWVDLLLEASSLVYFRRLL